MEQPNKQVDIESQQTSGRRRGLCLDIFIITSIVILFLSVAAMVLCAVMVLTQLRSEIKDSRHISLPGTVEKFTGTQPFPTFKMDNFAYVEAVSSMLETSIMKWTDVKFADRTSIGRNFVYDSTQQSLKPLQNGVYFIYVEVNITCTHRCSPGVLRLELDDKLTCEVELKAGKKTVEKKCWTVSPLDTNGLSTRMVVPQEGLPNWKLELVGSGLGMFLVD